jgi:hypothetical protein
MGKIIIILALIFFNFSFCQEVEFISKSDTLNINKDDYFGYLFQETDLSKAKLVAKVKGKGKINNISEIFNKLKRVTTKIGANSFFVENYTKIDSENIEFILSTYFCSDADFENNFKNVPKNLIFILGSENFSSEKTQNFKVNGEKHEISSGKYKKFEVKIGEELKINKGGFAGMTLWISGQEEKGSTFLSFTGLGLMGGGYNPVNGGMGVAINTGRINRIEPNFGLLLLKIFDEQK